MKISLMKIQEKLYLLSVTKLFLIVILIDKENIEEIIEAGVKTILLHKETCTTRLIMLLFIIHYKKIQQTLKKKLLNISIDNYVMLNRQMRKLHVVLLTNYSSLTNVYSLGEVGRYRMNKKLHLDIGMDKQVLNQRRYYYNYQIFN